MIVVINAKKIPNVEFSCTERKEQVNIESVCYTNLVQRKYVVILTEILDCFGQCTLGTNATKTTVSSLNGMAVIRMQTVLIKQLTSNHILAFADQGTSKCQRMGNGLVMKELAKMVNGFKELQ
jgi:hypothetical protein